MYRLRITGNIGFEYWMDIPQYEGLYQGSTYGRTKRGNKILKGQLTKGGYLRVGLSKNNVEKKYLIHRLIALTFLPNFKIEGCKERIEVNHKDENPQNNRIENLEWCTQSQNLKYGTGNRRRGESLINNKKTSKSVIQYDLQGNFIEEFPSLSEVERVKQYDQGFISKCCNGKKPNAYGFLWKFA